MEVNESDTISVSKKESECKADCTDKPSQESHNENDKIEQSEVIINESNSEENSAIISSESKFDASDKNEIFKNNEGNIFETNESDKYIANDLEKDLTEQVECETVNKNLNKISGNNDSGKANDNSEIKHNIENKFNNGPEIIQDKVAMAHTSESLESQPFKNDLSKLEANNIKHKTGNVRNKEGNRDKTKVNKQAHEVSNRNNEQSPKKCEIIEIFENQELILGTNEDGVEAKVKYLKTFLTEPEATAAYDCLVKDLPWQQKEGIYKSGEKYTEPRMTYWFGKAYKYSSVSWSENNEWHPQIEALRTAIISDENFSSEPGRELNSVMCNYYRSNEDSIGWHADDEVSLGRCPKIASISLGHERVFEVCKREEYYSRKDYKHRWDNDDAPFPGCTIMYRFHLAHGSLLIMEGSVQDIWLHRVPKEDTEMNGRINLTLRYIVDHDEELKEIEVKKKRARERYKREEMKASRGRNEYRYDRGHNYNDGARRGYNHGTNYGHDDRYYDYGGYYQQERGNRYYDRGGNSWIPRWNNGQQQRPMAREYQDNNRRQRSLSHNDSEHLDEIAKHDFHRFMNSHKK